MAWSDIRQKIINETNGSSLLGNTARPSALLGAKALIDKATAAESAPVIKTRFESTAAPGTGEGAAFVAPSKTTDLKSDAAAFKEQTKIPSLLERLKNIGTGAAKSYASSFTNTGGHIEENVQLNTENDISTVQRELANLKAEVASGELSGAELEGVKNLIASKEAEIKNKQGSYATEIDNHYKGMYDKADKLAESANTDISRAKEGASKLGQIAVDAGVAGLQMLGDAALGGGAVATLPMAVRVFGNSAQEARQSGATHNEAAVYGAANAAVEVLTEKIFDGVAGIYGKGAADDVVKGLINKLTTSKAGRNALNILASGTGEGLEEVISDVINPALRSIYNNKTVGQNYSEEDYSQWLYDGIVGAALGGIGGTVDTVKNPTQGITKTPTEADVVKQNPWLGNVPTAKPTNPIAPNLATKNTANITEDTTKTSANIAPNLNTAVEDKSAEVNKPTYSTANIAPKLNNNFPAGTGATSAEYGYKEAQNQTHSSDPRYTEAELENIDGLKAEDRTHQVSTVESAKARADLRFNSDYEGEKAALFDTKNTSVWGDEEFYLADKYISDAVQKARQSNDYSEVVKLQNIEDGKKTTWGQAGHAMAELAAKKPENIVARAATNLDSDIAKDLKPEEKKVILDGIYERAVELDGIADGDTGSVIDLIKRLNVERNTQGIFHKETSKQMTKWLDAARELPNAYERLKAIAAQQVCNISTDYQKTNPLDAIKSARRLFLLSKITTPSRNLASNNTFDPLDSFGNNSGILLDVILSKYTKTRAIPVDKSWFSKAKRSGAREGWIWSAIEVGLDADTINDTTRYETGGRTFKMSGNIAERLFSTFEKYQNYALQSTDELQKGGIRAETKRGLNALAEQGKLKSTDGIDEAADNLAKYRTFQDDSVSSKVTAKVRELGNLASVSYKGKKYGLGDVEVPFAKVAGNIIDRAVDYSPAGIVKLGVEVVNVVEKAKSGTLTTAEQAKAGQTFGRIMVGTVSIAAYTALALKGIIRVVDDEDDKDKGALEASEGKTGTLINLSAIARWFKGESTEWQSGDDIMSLGFLEPINQQMAMGAFIAEAYQDDGTISIKDIASATFKSIWQSVLDLPGLSNISDIKKNYDYSDGETEFDKALDAGSKHLASQAASFVVPNFVSGIASTTDPVARDKYSSDSWLGQAKDSIYSKIPGLKNTLPAKTDSWGNERTYDSGTVLNILNNNILPGQIGKYKTNAVNQELYKVADSTGKSVFPDKNPPNKVEFGGKSYDMTYEEKQKYKTTYGKAAFEYVQDLTKSDGYKKLDNDTKAAVLNGLYSYAGYKAKSEYFKSQGIDYESDTYSKVAEAESKGIMPHSYYLYQQTLSGIDTNGSATQAEKSKAINETDISDKYKGIMWEIQNPTAKAEKNPYTGTLANLGMPADENIAIMEARSTYSKKADFTSWLSSQGYNSSQIAAIWNVYK